MATQSDRFRSVGFCPHCGNNAHQEVVGKHNFQDPTSRDVTFYFLAKCETCERPLLYQTAAQRLGIGVILASTFSATADELLWPATTRLHPSVPPTVRTRYEEAAGIRARSPNGFANQIRQALEAICRDRGLADGTLHNRLRQLAARGELPPVLVEMTDVLRMLGNMGSHDDEESVDPAYVGAIDEFFRAVVEYVYVAPCRVAEFRAQLHQARAAREGG